MMMQFLRNRAARTLAPNEAAVGDRLPYLGHLDEVTLKTRDGLLVQTIHLRGFPFETSSDDELNYRKAMRETLLRGAASSRLAIYHHVVRRRVNTEFDSAPDNAFCRRLDDAWRARLARRQLYVNDIFLTLVRRPLQGGAGFIEKLLKKPGEDAAQGVVRVIDDERSPAGVAPRWLRARPRHERSRVALRGRRCGLVLRPIGQHEKAEGLAIRATRGSSSGEEHVACDGSAERRIVRWNIVLDGAGFSDLLDERRSEADDSGGGLRQPIGVGRIYLCDLMNECSAGSAGSDVG